MVSVLANRAIGGAVVSPLSVSLDLSYALEVVPRNPHCRKRPMLAIIVQGSCEACSTPIRMTGQTGVEVVRASQVVLCMVPCCFKVE